MRRVHLVILHGLSCQSVCHRSELDLEGEIKDLSSLTAILSSKKEITNKMFIETLCRIVFKNCQNALRLLAFIPMWNFQVTEINFETIVFTWLDTIGYNATGSLHVGNRFLYLPQLKKVFQCKWMFPLLVTVKKEVIGHFAWWIG